MWPAEAEYHKRTKYQELDTVCLFVPLAIETLGAFSPAAAAFFTDLGKWVADKLEESWVYSFLLQHVAVEVQQVNVVVGLIFRDTE